MSLSTAKKCVDLLFAEDAKHSPYINEDKTNGIILDFIGGEPLLEIDLIDKIMDYFLATAVRLKHRWAFRHMISMSSNGVDYFNPAVIRFLKKHKGRVNIGITIDGNEKLHNMCRVFPNGSPSYQYAADAFADAKERFNQHGTKITLSPDNIKYLFDACRDMIDKFDLQYLHGNPVFEAEWTNDNANVYYNQLKQLADWMVDSGRYERTWVSFFDDFTGKPMSETDNRNFCGGDGKMLAFDVDGTCYPCYRFSPIAMPLEISRKYIIGHCDIGLEAIDCQHQCVECISSITRRSQSTDECWNCPIASGCAWCSAWNAECSGGDINVRCTRICPMHYARVMATRYYYGRIAEVSNTPNLYEWHVPEDKGIAIVGNEEFQMLKNMDGGGDVI